MLPVKVFCVLLGLAGTVWSGDEGTDFSKAGAAGRGPRVVEPGAVSDCKHEKSWAICSDEDWGPKCPSGCRIQGLADQADKDFSKRIDNIKKTLAENQNIYKSTDVTTKETYNLIRGSLVQGQTGEGTYEQVSDDLRKRIEILKIKVMGQINRIKTLENGIREQVQSMKRLEVDIDIKIRACKGSCARGLVYNVDTESYDNIQKQLLQAGAVSLQPETNVLPVLKMRRLKGDPPTLFKTLASEKDGEGQYEIFTGIDQHLLYIERPQQVVKDDHVQSGKETTYQGSKVSYTGGDVGTYGKEVQVTGGGSKTSTTVQGYGRTISCTKTITRKTVYGPDGPREEITESYSGGEGDECSKLDSQGMAGAQSGTGAGKGFVVTGGEKSTTTKVTTQGRTISCTKTTTTRVVQGPDGPKEVVSESFSGGEGDECSRLGSLGIGETGTAGGTYNVKVSSGNGFSDLSQFPNLDNFFQGGTGSKVQTSSSTSGSSTSSLTQSKQGGSTTSTKVIDSPHDAFRDLGDGEVDHFSSFQLGPPNFPSISDKSSSSYTKTVVSSSSRGYTKEGSPVDGKLMKSAPLYEDLGPVQHDESGEDTPDLQARSTKKEAVKLQEDYSGTGKSTRK